ncbi:hypothetical protein HK097_007373 [Rhizophlyctis rosea]|uniref:Uncharacterized protein n=1 Tax=Rhizophlyctis rosea TaxID=64517 RepID=A0AAD5SET4_9FUNG|nr:hypothetical protein HK097_007373 [Rhizophlyctis rosea]
MHSKDRAARNPVVDEALRQRISKRHLEDLERDNFTTMDEVEIQVPSSGRKVKRFDSVGEDGATPIKKPKKGILKRTSSIALKKNLATLIQESDLNRE